MNVKWDIEHVFFYLVSFIALILLIVGAVNLTRTAISFIAPVDDHYNPYTYNEFLSHWEEHFGEELMEQEKERFTLINETNSKRALQRDLLSSLAYIAVALPVYLYHWRKIPWLDSVESK